MSKIAERRSSDTFVRVKQKMQDVSPNIHQVVVQSLQPENSVPSENTVYPFPKVDMRTLGPRAYTMWELSERTLKKHEIILDWA